MPSWDGQANEQNVYINRRTLIAFVISLALHAGTLLYLSTKKVVVATTVANMTPKTMSVSIAGLSSSHKPSESHKNILVRKQHVKLKSKTPTHTQIIVTDNAAIVSPQHAPLPVDINAPADLMSYIKAKRLQAQELEDRAFLRMQQQGDHLRKRKGMRLLNVIYNKQEQVVSSKYGACHLGLVNLASEAGKITTIIPDLN